jgi:thiamine-phosphate pyrophosphorylase
MKQRQFPSSDIYAITASRFSLGRSNLEVVRRILEAGVKIIQYREKEFSMHQKYQECLAIRDLTAQYQACFVINDDIHLALAVEADGVHVGQDDLPPEAVRDLVGDKILIGLSTHSPEQMEQACGSGVVDYIGAGPLFQTFTKKDVQPPVGLRYLDYVVSHSRLPFVAIGGIKESNAAEVISHGAKCICLVTDIVSTPDIGGKIQAIRARMA